MCPGTPAARAEGRVSDSKWQHELGWKLRLFNLKHAGSAANTYLEASKLRAYAAAAAKARVSSRAGQPV